MKIKKGFVLRRVLDEAIVVASGEVSKTFHGMVKLNDTGADVWTWISEGKTEDEIADKLTAEYGITKEKAAKDTKAMIEQMATAGLIEE